ncbi:hypothetical protein ABZW18_21190 [Streptomyces sp. NPDC004647]|uniref:hypothetical protein n=1 Tax=Streptomyces sp. NPDC004647 TaxID=3154671 RepID=UPI0033A1E14A
MTIPKERPRLPVRTPGAPRPAVPLRVFVSAPDLPPSEQLAGYDAERARETIRAALDGLTIEEVPQILEDLLDCTRTLLPYAEARRGQLAAESAERADCERDTTSGRTALSWPAGKTEAYDRARILALANTAGRLLTHAEHLRAQG